MKNNQPFDQHDIYGAYQKAPSSIQKIVFSQLISINLVKILISTLIILSLSPLAFLYLEPNLPQNQELLIPLISTWTGIYLLFASLSLFLLSYKKFPGLQEIKDYLGYTE
jgi:hypothetical protein